MSKAEMNEKWSDVSYLGNIVYIAQKANKRTNV